MNFNKEQVQDGGAGAALSVLWMIYGEWFMFIPPNLSEVKYAALTAALGVVGTGLVNLIRRVWPVPTIIVEPEDAPITEEIPS